MERKGAREKLEESFMSMPPLLYGKPLKIEEKGNYLGEELGLNVSESVSLTIRKRIGLATKAIFEIKSVIEDTRSKMVGGILSRVLLWQSSVLPFLLNNSSCWMEIKKRDMDKLIKLQNLFLSVLLGVKNCPTPLMLWDLKILSMPLQILKSKLILYHHISTLPENALSYQILCQQERLNLPSVFDDIRSFLARYEVVDIKSFTKKEWATFVKKCIHNENREYLLDASKRYKKLDYLGLSCEDYEVKPCF